MLFQNEHLQQGRCTTIRSLIVGFGWCATYFIYFNCIIELNCTMNSCNWKYTFPLYNFLVPYLRQIIHFGQIKLVAKTIGKLRKMNLKNNFL